MLVEVEGLEIEITVTPVPLSPGDFYVARRNGDWKFYTVKNLARWGDSTKPTIVTTDSWNEADMVFPVENGYPFNTGETRKVLSV